MKNLLRLSKLVAPLFPVMILAVVFGTLGFFCAIGIPVFGAKFLVSSKTFFFPLKILIIIGVLRGILHYLEQYCNHFIAFKILARIRDIVFQKLRSLGPAKMESKEKGNMISILTSDIELLEVFYAHTISPVCICVLVSFGMCAFIFRYNFILSIVALFFYAIVGIFVPFCVNKIAVKYAKIYRNDFALMNSFLIDCLRGISMSIMYSTGIKKLSVIQQKSDELSQSQRKLSLIEGFTQALSGFFVTLGSLAMLFTSLYLFKKNEIDFGSVIICTVAMFSSFGPVIAVANLGSGLSQTIASASRVLSILDEKPIVEEIISDKKINFNEAGLKNVSFGYKDSLILENLSLSFPANRIIGIKGKSGSGKSTLLKLLMHFWEADSGEVTISSQNIKNIDSKNLRLIESSVTQETMLFHDTIENNLKIAKLDATKEEIVTACKKANIHDFIDSLPKKYETEVSELGDNFSGGERQRLGLARAFLHNGDFILLDEPTSNLDSWNERQIMKSVKDESKNKTVLIVSHRESTFEYADEVINFESKRKS